jgi:hypothetical protein
MLLRPDLLDSIIGSLPSAVSVDARPLRMAPRFTLGEWAVGSRTFSVEAVDSAEIDEAMHASVFPSPLPVDSTALCPLCGEPREHEEVALTTGIKL